MDKHGHIILKNTGVKTSKDYAKWAPKFVKKVGNYKGGYCPRKEIGDGVLDVSAEPPHLFMDFHNEMSYHSTLPGVIAFWCKKKSEIGGITLLCDNVK